MGRAVTSMRPGSEDFEVTVTQNHSHAPGIVSNLFSISLLEFINFNFALTRTSYYPYFWPRTSYLLVLEKKEKI